MRGAKYPKLDLKPLSIGTRGPQKWLFTHGKSQPCPWAATVREMASTHPLCQKVTVLSLGTIGGKGDTNHGNWGYNQFTVYNELLSSRNDFGSLLVFSFPWHSDLRDEVSSVFSNSFKTAVSWKCLVALPPVQYYLFVCLFHLVSLLCLWPLSLLPCGQRGPAFFMFSQHGDSGMTNTGNKWWINPLFHCPELELWRAPGECWQPGQHHGARGGHTAAPGKVFRIPAKHHRIGCTLGQPWPASC